jgi:Zn-dependent peptidase ImmA (M78 family)/transcriptional regulator with XRE-family HTH domain
MSNRVVGLNPRVLLWAREQAGMSLEEVGQKMARTPASIAAWEEGSDAPTYVQLEKLAYQVYKRPLGLFFFPEPPSEEDLSHSFRTVPDFELEDLRPDTRFKIREARSFQLSLHDLTDGVNPSPRKIFRDIRVNSHPSQQIAAEARRYLSISFQTQAETWRSSRDALRGWRSALESSGVFVFKDAFEQADVSGFCLYDQEFPIILVNNSTPPTRQIFTICHELAHILSATTGMTKLNDRYIETLTGEAHRIEIFCNRLAADLLVPQADLRRLVARQQVTDDLVADVASVFKVSREVVLRRLLDEGRVTKSYYEAKSAQWTSEAIQARAQQTAGGDYYKTQAAYLGDAYLRLAFQRYYRGSLSIEELADHLNVRPTSIPGLEQQLLSRPH